MVHGDVCLFITDICDRSSLLHCIVKHCLKLQVMYMYTTRIVNSSYHTFCTLVSIKNTSAGFPVAGENYTLEYSVRGTTEPVSFQWWKRFPNELNMVSINDANVHTSQLQFSPLNQQYHNGSYCCNITVGQVNHNKCFEVTVRGMIAVSFCISSNCTIFFSSQPKNEHLW